MSTRTTDFDRTGASRYYTISKLGPKRSLTPEGFLLCEAVPVARTGEMLYAEGEIAGEGNEILKGDLDGIIRVTRGPEDLFRPETIASFEGKPVTLGHPDEFVAPENYSKYAKGTMVNVRRGEGIDVDVMLADLLVTDAEAIKAIQSDGIEEVSLGYEADYEQTGPGRAAQRNIVGNHNALVERGRCGPRCAIGDEAMPTQKKKSFADRIRAALKTNDSKELEKVAQEVEDEEEETEAERKEREAKEERKETKDSLKAIMDKLTAMDAEMAEIKKKVEDDDEDDPGKTNDQGDLTQPETAEKLDDAGVKLYTGDAASRILPLAEILAPGTKLPTFDAKTNDAQRAAALCRCQRKALDTAYKTDAGKEAITPFLGGHTADFATLPAPVVNAAFLGAASLMKVRNNDHTNRLSVATTDFGKTVDAASLNKKNREFWAKRSGTN